MEQAVERVKVCAYCRVSTKEDEQLDSYNNQIRFFEREFGERAGYELVEIYRDRGTSGTKLSCPGFDNGNSSPHHRDPQNSGGNGRRLSLHRRPADAACGTAGREK